MAKKHSSAAPANSAWPDWYMRLRPIRSPSEANGSTVVISISWKIVTISTDAAGSTSSSRARVGRAMLTKPLSTLEIVAPSDIARMAA